MLIAVAAAFGLLCGSFANVLVARVPHGEGWVTGSSRCPGCRHDIAWYDNIPLLSWLILRGRCRHCGMRISARYPVIEASVGLLFALIAWTFGSAAVAWLLAFSALLTVALAAIDFEHHRLPDPLVAAMGVAALVFIVAYAAVTGDWWSLARAAVGAGGLGAFYFLFWFVYPRGLGFGDVKLALPVGAVLGFLGWAPLLVGAILGPLVGGVFAVAAAIRARGVKGVRLAYGPAIIAGFWIGALWGSSIGAWYLGWTTGGAV